MVGQYITNMKQRMNNIYKALQEFINIAKKEVPQFTVNDIVYLSEYNVVAKVERVYTSGMHTDAYVSYEATELIPVYSCRVMDYKEDTNEYIPSSVIRLANDNITLYEIQKNSDGDFEYTFGTLTFIKSDGVLYVYGVYSSYYEDSQEDILTDESHRYFTKGVNSGKFEYPDIYVAHIRASVGKCQMIDYDDRGFAIFGGTIFKEWEEDVADIVRKSADADIMLGLSHGFNEDTVEYDSEGYITKYISHEISILPLYPVILNGKRTTSASNKYTILLTEGT